MNAIMLAGDRKAALPVCGINKAFLLLEGWPLFIHVITALNHSPSIETIYIVGPRNAIMAALEKSLSAFLFTKKIEVLEQKESLLANSVYAYEYACGGENKKPALFLPADIPLVTGEEIEAFIAMSDMNQYDYCLGVTSENHLKQFYPKIKAKIKECGIKMPYLYLKDHVYRMNNLHIARLPPQHGASMLQTIYNHRRQKNIWNRVSMIYALFTAGHARALLLLYMLAQAAVLCARFGFHRIAKLFRKPILLHQVEAEISCLLQTRFKAVEINVGGAALDIDDEATYKTIAVAFRKWHEALMPKEKAKEKEDSHQVAACPFQAECHGVPKEHAYPL